MDNILNKIYDSWKNAETNEAAVAYMDCYFLVLDYIKEQEYNEKN